MEIESDIIESNKVREGSTERRRSLRCGFFLFFGDEKQIIRKTVEMRLILFKTR